MGLLEARQLKPSNRAFWQGALLYVADAGLDPKNYVGGGAVSKLHKSDTPWVLMLGGEIGDKRTEGSKTYSKDSVWIVAPSNAANPYDLIATDFSKWRKKVNKLLANYDAKNERDQKRLSIAIMIGTGVAAIVLSAIATPAVGAAVAAAGAALAAGVEAGNSPSELATAAANGTADIAAAAAVEDPEVAAHLAEAAELVITATETASSTDAPTVVDETVVIEEEPSPLERLGSWAEENPGTAAGVGGGLVVALLVGLRLIIRG